MANITLKLLIDSDNNSLTFSKNYRIFSTVDPTCNITGLTELVEDLILTSPNALDMNNVYRSFRYSRNKLDWSLWYDVSPTNLGDADDIIFDDDQDYYFEMKYEYDDGTFDEMPSVLAINEIKLRFSALENHANTFAPVVLCSDEKCSTIIKTTEPSFRPYEVDSAIGIFKELSFFTNKVFGHEVVYFRTVPESGSGDFIFKEWTLFKNVDRKCLKVLVPKNSFPSNDPKYTEFGLDFELPFEIHLDHRYFQSVFGKTSHPRHRDFLYFPLINRMYEVTGSYLHRGFMMAPTYWKVQLQKYKPNIDMLLTDDSRTYLDNVIQSADDLFSEDVVSDTSDGLMPKQYDTISSNFDSSRNAIHPDLTIKPLKYNFNHASLIENYYDLSAIVTETSSFEVTNESPAISTTIETVTLPSVDEDELRSYGVILAYQDSTAYRAWKNNALITTDLNVLNADSHFVKIRGPLDTLPNHDGTSVSGRYIRIEAYSDLSFTKQKNILNGLDANNKNMANFKIRETSILYNAVPLFDNEANCNISYTALFNLNKGSTVVQFLTGYDNETSKGLKISGQFTLNSGSTTVGSFTINVTINSLLKTYTIPNVLVGNWHAMVISLSNEFNQCGIYLYTITEDIADLTNHNDFVNIFNSISTMADQEFDLSDQKYYIPSSDMYIANIRLFNTMIKEEEHDFILSQQYLKDESKLLIIDNCKPQQNLPFIAKNK